MSSRRAALALAAWRARARSRRECEDEAVRKTNLHRWDICQPSCYASAQRTLQVALSRANREVTPFCGHSPLLLSRPLPACLGRVWRSFVLSCGFCWSQAGEETGEDLILHIDSTSASPRFRLLDQRHGKEAIGCKSKTFPSTVAPCLDDCLVSPRAQLAQAACVHNRSEDLA